MPDSTGLPQNSVSETLHWSGTISYPSSGGHLQGIQYYSYGNKEYYVMSGSSSKEAFLLFMDKKSNRTQTKITLMQNPMKHAGGLQIRDGYVAVGVEDNEKKDTSVVLVYPLEHPKGLEKIQPLTIERRGVEKRYTAGCVAITRYGDEVIVAVGNWDTKQIDFYTSAAGESLDFKYLCTIDPMNSVEKNIRDEWLPYQSIQLVTNTAGGLDIVGLGMKRGNEKRLVADKYLLNMTECSLSMRTRKEYELTEGWAGNAGLYQDENGQLMIISGPYVLEKTNYIEVFR